MREISKKVFLTFAVVLLAAGCSKAQQQEYQQSQSGVVQSTAVLSDSPTVTSTPKVKTTPPSALVTPTPAPTPTVQSVTPTTAPITDYVTYKGQDGKTALEILEANYKVEVETYSGIGDFVTSIAGVKPDSKHFWEFYVNGKSSNVGASSYVTKNSDVIEWKLTEINQNGE